MDSIKYKLMEAEKKACSLFMEVEKANLIKPGKSEKELNEEIFTLAEKLFGIEKYWHKRIVRAGINTLSPYSENPPNLTLQEQDILFIDFGPIFEDWEADLGRTYVLGNDPVRLKLKKDVEGAWFIAKKWFSEHDFLTGAQFYDYISNLAISYGYCFGGELAGHLVGQFPHERLDPGNYGLYVHPENNNNMFALDAEGKERNWILEIHFVDREKQIGSFFEQLLT